MHAMLCFLGQEGGEQLNSFVGALRENGFAVVFIGLIVTICCKSRYSQFVNRLELLLDSA